MRTLRLLLASAEVDLRVELKKAFLEQPDFEIVAETGSGDDIAALVKEHKPDVIVLDSRLEGEASNGLEVAEELSVSVPALDIVMISDEGGESIFLRRAMFAGVRQVLPKPFDAADLVEILRMVGEMTFKKKAALAAERGEELVHESRTFSVFSTKGGVGRTLLATNLALALRDRTRKKVCLVDLDLQFGDVAIMLNLKPQHTIAGLAREIADAGVLEDDTLGSYILTHEESGLDVIVAPNRPDEAEIIKANHVKEILRSLAEKYHYVVLDLPTYVNDITLMSLEMSSLILVLLTMELPALKTGKLMVELMQSLGFGQEKLRVILNREDPHAPFTVDHIADVLGLPVAKTIPSDGGHVIPAVNEGAAAYLRGKDDGEAVFAKAIGELADALVQADATKAEEGEGG